ncbi:MAG: hypothetical protein LPJ89_08630 [Hymenobacteraceae bacterium]|nr:hypothetical protein [Hymenobacteraceae bacterium]MDX5396687.1 hypothetical protein [Hymenobacteraceae bacterium]MDX5443830.1 hypothetical protein [Hymenobacteraceae bacterium]MDX5512747.1 hypothetical protein [Hymenobacteraceae bacterium]
MNYLFMIRQTILFTILLFSTLTTQAQLQKTYTQLYIGLEAGAAFTTINNSEFVGRTAALHATIAPKKHKYFYRARFQNTVFKDNSRVYREPFFGNLPEHKILNLSFSAGKPISFTTYFNVNLLGGVTLSAYKKPENIHYDPSPNYPDLYYYYHDVKHYYRPGLLLQAEGVAMPFHRLGLSLSTYYHFVPPFSTAGATLSLLIGKIRPKGFGIY